MHFWVKKCNVENGIQFCLFRQVILLIRLETSAQNAHFRIDYTIFWQKSQHYKKEIRQKIGGFRVFYLFFCATSSTASAIKVSTALETVSPARLRTDTVPSSTSLAPMMSM